VGDGSHLRGRVPLSTIVGDALLAFAVAYVCTSYLAIYKKYQAELAGVIPSPPEPVEPT
jgi:hypothetical protein